MQEARKEADSPRSPISLLSRAGKLPLKVVANRLSDCFQAPDILPDEQCGFRPDRSTVDMLFVARRLQELGRRRKIYLCFVDIKKLPRPRAAVVNTGSSRCPVPTDHSHPPIPRWHANTGTHGSRRALGFVEGHTGIATRICAVSSHVFRSGDLIRSCAIQRDGV